MSLSTGKIFWLAAIALFFVLAPSLVWAGPEETNERNEYGMKPIAVKAGLYGNAISGSTVPGLIGNIVGVALSFVGAAFFILILYAGILWMTAAGNAERVESAKNILIAAAIGLIIVLSAYVITRFVFTGLGVDDGGSVEPPNGQVVNCSADNVAESCGQAMVCNANSQCVTKCEYLYGAQNSGVCQSAGSCQTSINESACPGKDEVCCYTD